jgi:hypothetical protein
MTFLLVQSAVIISLTIPSADFVIICDYESDFCPDINIYDKESDFCPYISIYDN